MDREEKAAAVAEIGEELERSTAVFAVDYRGISVPQAAELRIKLNDADASFNVVKNRLAKRATGDAGATDLDEHLVGPTALTYVRGDAVVAAKTISDFVKEHGVPTYKGGLMDGAALSAEQFAAISRLPGVDVLRGQLVGLAASPLTGVVRTLNQLIQGLTLQLGQVAEQGLVGGDAPAEEPAAEEEAEAPEAEAAAPEPEAEAEPEAATEAPAEEAAQPEAPAEEEPAAEATEDEQTETDSEPAAEAEDTTADGEDADAADDKED
ncbi:MAG: 50S ribosomal protein L10 [Solirubrobacterales bacterium]|nr:50S ribosomal protein L10 [Solirubrobacterales bacterium]MCB8969201.1 50S ribosomal protein L10 [Thermoleophilales bacterium]MCO5328027.1 50S ribosomal protein L10 [Solirubrobacterales bacterium]